MKSKIFFLHNLSIFLEEEIKFGEEKKGYRRIYEGQIQFDIWELDILNEFQKFLIKNKYKTISW